MNNDPEPIYGRIRELFDEGFTIDWVVAPFITITHILFLVGTPLAYYFAPQGFWQVMLGWTVVHAFVACLSTTVYSHRLVSHGAAKNISWPVHIVFGYIGQVFAIQGSVLRWASMHIIHHGVDRNGKHHLDPYSATWFDSGWRNFLWSHVLTYFFRHPETTATEQAFASKTTPLLLWQHRLYLPLLIALNFILPLAVGYFLTNSILGALCLQSASIAGFILAQHNTWTVNSVTHMWGSKKGAISSAKNNYIWMGPLGEGNHHADHHDHGKDFRNGFGWSGWLLDPTRYVILLLRFFGLVKGLQRASKLQEAQIIAKRAINELRAKASATNWSQIEDRMNHHKAEWIESVGNWERYKKQKRLMKQRLTELDQQRALVSQGLREKRAELMHNIELLKIEAKTARKLMQYKKRAFFSEIESISLSLGARAV